MSNRAFVGNAADEKQVKKAKRRDRENEQRDRADLQWVLSTVQGRRFLWTLLCDAGIFKISFRPGRDGWTDFYEGKRQWGTELFVKIQEFNPDLYHLMAKEAHDLHEIVKPDPPADDPQRTEIEGDDDAGSSDE
jgi:hypothetical protein